MKLDLRYIKELPRINVYANTGCRLARDPGASIMASLSSFGARIDNRTLTERSVMVDSLSGLSGEG